MASRPLRYWRFCSLVSLVGLVGVHWHVIEALRKLRLDMVIITVCSSTLKVTDKDGIHQTASFILCVYPGTYVRDVHSSALHHAAAEADGRKPRRAVALHSRERMPLWGAYASSVL